MGRIKSFWGSFQSSGLPLSKASDYYNCINKLILDAIDQTEILHLNPPAELHLLLGVKNKIFDELNNAWGDNNAYKWAHGKEIIRVGYRGGSMEGNQFKQLLMKVSELESLLLVLYEKFATAIKYATV